MLPAGTQERILKEITSSAGVITREGATRTDSILVSLWVGSITSGTLRIEVFTLTDEGKETSIILFPEITVGSTALLLRKSAVSLQRFRVKATYTGVVDYEVYVRAIEGAGEASSRILGSNAWSVSQASAGTTAALLVPSSLIDRNGMVIKNWSLTSTIFIAESEIGATVGNGYPLAPRDALALDIAAGAAVWAITDTGTADVRVAQSGA